MKEWEGAGGRRVAEGGEDVMEEAGGCTASCRASSDMSCPMACVRVLSSAEGGGGVVAVRCCRGRCAVSSLRPTAVRRLVDSGRLYADQQPRQPGAFSQPSSGRAFPAFPILLHQAYTAL